MIELGRGEKEKQKIVLSTIGSFHNGLKEIKTERIMEAIDQLNIIYSPMVMRGSTHNPGLSIGSKIDEQYYE